MADQPADPRTSTVFKRRQSPTVAKRLFEREAKLILDGWVDRRRQHRQDNSALGLVEKPADWMLRHTYALVKSLITKGHQDILHDLTADIGQRHRGRIDVGGKPFKQALLIMFWWNPEHTSKPLLDRQRRSEFSDAMEYAYLHRVRPKDLIGFIKAAGLKKIPAKVRNGHREPGFENLQLQNVITPAEAAASEFIENVD